jgi:hypothetical protein
MSHELKFVDIKLFKLGLLVSPNVNDPTVPVTPDDVIGKFLWKRRTVYVMRELSMAQARTAVYELHFIYSCPHRHPHEKWVLDCDNAVRCPFGFDYWHYHVRCGICGDELVVPYADDE